MPFEVVLHKDYDYKRINSLPGAREMMLGKGTGYPRLIDLHLLEENHSERRQPVPECCALIHNPHRTQHMSSSTYMPSLQLKHIASIKIL